jgi:phytanoyl-CoA hydroxylase
MPLLSPEQAAAYHRDGYLVLPGFADEQTVARLLRRGGELLATCDPESNPSVFSTRNQTETSDEYFLRSGENVSFFLEPGALDAEGKLTRAKEARLSPLRL